MMNKEEEKNQTPISTVLLSPELASWHPKRYSKTSAGKPFQRCDVSSEVS